MTSDPRADAAAPRSAPRPATFVKRQRWCGTDLASVRHPQLAAHWTRLLHVACIWRALMQVRPLFACWEWGCGRRFVAARSSGAAGAPQVCLVVSRRRLAVQPHAPPATVDVQVLPTERRFWMQLVHVHVREWGGDWMDAVCGLSTLVVCGVISGAEPPRPGCNSVPPPPSGWHRGDAALPSRWTRSAPATHLSVSGGADPVEVPAPWTSRPGERGAALDRHTGGRMGYRRTHKARALTITGA